MGQDVCQEERLVERWGDIDWREGSVRVSIEGARAGKSGIICASCKMYYIWTVCVRACFHKGSTESAPFFIMHAKKALFSQSVISPRERDRNIANRNNRAKKLIFLYKFGLKYIESSSKHQ